MPFNYLMAAAVFQFYKSTPSMTKRFRILKSSRADLHQLILAVLAGVALCLCGQAKCENLRIVVAGDGRADYLPRAQDHDGINTVINREIAEAVLREKATLLLWTGDLVNVTDNSCTTLRYDLLAWRNIMQPLYNQGVKVLPTRGNHEMSCPESAAAWNEVFSGRYALPTNGPATETNLTFYYTTDSVLIVGVDQYSHGREEVNQSWLDQVLKQNHKPFIFVYGHEPAFMDGHHADTLDSHPVLRDAMWKSLIQAGARVYFCGHDHFYDHMRVVRAGADPGPELHQFTAGTAGAPFYPSGEYAGRNSDWELISIKGGVE